MDEPFRGCMSGLKKNLKLIGLILLGGVIVTLLAAGCTSWIFGKNEEKANPLTIKVEDFSVFLFESSEEIYRANVKSPAMWAGLKDRAAQDAGYAMHYKWLYDTYGSWDENRRAQLNEIMQEYHPQPMAEQLIQDGRQGAGSG